jgi:hypothetical protein
MSRCTFFRFLFIIVVVLGVLGFSSVLFAQGRSDQAFEHVRQVQESNAERFLDIANVEASAIGVDENNEYVIKVFTAVPGVAGIPRSINRVPIQVEVTGRFYALGTKSSKAPPGLAVKSPPAAPSNLTAVAISSSQIGLSWTDNSNNESGFVVEMFYLIGFVEIGRVGKNITGGTVINLGADTEYFFRVFAYNNYGVSDYSNVASATTLSSGGNPPTSDDPTARFAPTVPIGVSTGHIDITAGTIGCRVKINGVAYALSNNHIFANCNLANIDDPILQPGPYDGGALDTDYFGSLYKYVPIVFGRGGKNTVDAAIALIDNGERTLSNTTLSGYTPSSTPQNAIIGLLVKKYGRTTRETHGQVSAVNWNGRISYGGGLFAYFQNQIYITDGSFSDGGDSGSLVVTDNNNSNPVALLFAGNSYGTIANPIQDVLSKFSGATIE